MRLSFNFLGITLLASTGLFQLAEAQTASWSPVFDLPLNAVHTSLLPNGKVLMWGRIEENDLPIIWDPLTKTYVSVPTPNVNIFCTGHIFLADGSLLVSGGHIAYDIGTKDLLAFDGFRNVWKRLPDMKYDRWYAGALTLSNGQVFIAGGTYLDENGAIKGRQYPEIYDPESNTISELTNGYFRDYKYYPNMYTTTDTKIMMHRPALGFRKLNPFNTTNIWAGSDPAGFKFEQFSFARYLPNKVLSVSSIKDAEFKYTGKFDAKTNVWTQLADSVGGRRDCDTTILSNGQVVITGGSSVFADPTTATMESELYDPATDTITVGPSASVARVYHASAVLLPDGSVLKVGSGSGGSPKNVRQKNGEIYYPWYFNSPTRPVITFAPSILSYGATNNITVSTTKPLREAALVRMGSTTHGTNFSQLYVPIILGNTGTGTANTVKVPSSKGDIPPGPYMLVLVNTDGEPSVAKLVTVGNDMTKPLLTSFTAVNGTITNVTNDGLIAQDTNFGVVNVPANTKNLEVATGEFEFTSTRKFVNGFRLRTGTRWPMAGTLKAEAWNNADGAWETLGTANAGSNGTNSTITTYFERRLNAREYIDETTKKVRIRLTFRNPGSTRPLTNAELDVLVLYFTY